MPQSREWIIENTNDQEYSNFNVCNLEFRSNNKQKIQKKEENNSDNNSDLENSS